LIFKRELPDSMAAQLVGHRPCLTFVTLAELAKWVEISAFAVKRGRARPQNDTWIAAACLVHEVPLATLNVKDFADFVDHEGLALITR
jgi:toxin FitB